MAGSTSPSQPLASVVGQNPSFHYALVKKISAIFSTCCSHALSLPTAIIAASCILLTPLPASAIYVYYGDSKYTTVYGPTWEEAQANAVRLGGNLVTINDAAENNFLYSQTWATGYSLYIGLSDRLLEGTWVWADGSLSTYTNWGPAQPSNGAGLGTLVSNGENYAQLLYDGSSFTAGQYWNDISNEYQPGGYFTPQGIVEIKLGSGSSSGASVPGPLPVLGLAAAFCFSRKLRKRIKLHKVTSAVSTSPAA